MFVPRRCPSPHCPAHAHPPARFFQRNGSYHPRCRNHPVPRFRCRSCGQHFSRQTFRADYRQKKPHLNPLLVTSAVAPLRRKGRLSRSQKARRALFGSHFQGRTHSATTRRDRRNPLFPIHHTNARLRHFLSRLRRRSWCVSKKSWALKAHLDIAALWINYARGITNRTRTTPAQALGIAPRAYRAEELLAWRQDWGPLSPDAPQRNPNSSPPMSGISQKR